MPFRAVPQGSYPSYGGNALGYHTCGVGGPEQWGWMTSHPLAVRPYGAPLVAVLFLLVTHPNSKTASLFWLFSLVMNYYFST